MFGLSMLSHTQRVFEQSYTFGGQGKTDGAFVTPAFDIGSKSNVQVKVKTNLDNAWAAFTFSLINEATGVTYDFGKEVSYYHGSDSDGSWSEGGKSASTTIPGVPPGRYYLRVEPEMEESSQRMLNLTMMRYDIEVDTGGGNKIWFVPVFFLLLIPPIFSTYRVLQFENARWADSDYGNPIGGSSSGGDDD
jgi:hypothetical protein